MKFEYSTKMSERRQNAIPEISDTVSVKSILSSTPGGKEFPDIWVAAYIGGTDKKKYFKAKLDTGTDQCLISQHVVENKWGTELIDSSKKITLNTLSMNEVHTLGQIRLTVCLRRKIKEIDVPFQVIPNSIAKYQFDALLSNKLIHRRDILVSGGDWQDEETDSEEDD
jgi:hypothetical protein